MILLRPKVGRRIKVRQLHMLKHYSKVVMGRCIGLLNPSNRKQRILPNIVINIDQRQQLCQSHCPTSLLLTAVRPLTLNPFAVESMALLMTVQLRLNAGWDACCRRVMSYRWLIYYSITNWIGVSVDF